MEFLKSNISEEWMDLVEEFPQIFLELSPLVESRLVDYPKIYTNRDELSNLRFGFECGVGWKSIIREFCVEITDLIQSAKDAGHEIHYKTCIMKEKFGDLRDQGHFYGPDAELYRQKYYDISENMEEKSRYVCEVTGGPGIRALRGMWYKTLSPELQEQLGYHPA
jgi:hypothetical protein